MSKQATAGTSTATRGQRGRRHHTALGTAALVLVLATLGMTGTAAAAPTGGNAPSAKACQKDGYQSLARAESPTVAFTSSDECTAYAAEGGTLTALQTDPSRALCESLSGTFGAGGPDEVGFYNDRPVVFVCNNIPLNQDLGLSALGQACLADGGSALLFSTPPGATEGDLTCYAPPS
jgi:hypothetical protein